MNKLLIIVGPTAIGKTELALAMARKFNGELLSADSRQVYKGLDIGTGKDLPKGAVPQYRNDFAVYSFGGIPVWGYDLVDPYQEFNVSQYVKDAKKILNDIWKRGKLPVLVGGTGFYVQALIDGVETLDIPQNKPLRAMLETMKLGEIFEILAQLDATKAASLNSSDRKNKVRLIRAIEVADARIRGAKNKSIEKIHAETLYIGLTMEIDTIKQRIIRRVEKRIADGLINEIEQLQNQGIAWDNQSMSSMGYSQWKAYFEHTMSEDEVIKQWIHDEQKYVKRQMTWFKKDKRIQWFSIEKTNWEREVEDTVQKWYSMRI